MASELESLRNAIEQLTRTVQGGGTSAAGGSGGSSKPSPAVSPSPRGPQQLDSAAKQASLGLGKFVTGLISVGTIMKGLQGTTEGYQMNYAFSHLAFEIADIFRGPIRLLTRELEGFARVLHLVNAGATSAINNRVVAMNHAEATRLTQQKTYSGSFAIAEKGIREKKPEYEALGLKQLEEGKAEAEKRIQENSTFEAKANRMPGPTDPLTVATKERDLYDSGIKQLQRLKKELANEPAQPVATKPSFGAVKPVGAGKESEHLQPMLQTSIGQVQDLQNKLQALSTENPAQEKGLSLIENIAKWVYMIAHPTVTEAQANAIFNPVKAN